MDYYSSKLISCLVSENELKAQNVTSKLIYDSTKQSLNSLEKIQEKQVIFINRTDQETLGIMLEVFFRIKAYNPDVEYNIIYIPGINFEIIEFMDINGLNEYFNIYNFKMDLFPLDSDLLSLEANNSFKEIYSEKNYSSMINLAEAVIKLEACFGKIQNKFMKGDMSVVFEQMLVEKEKEYEIKEDDQVFGMIVFDRAVDIPIIMASNNTYEGLIDENFGIDWNKILVKKDLIFQNMDANLIPKNLKVNKKGEVEYTLNPNTNKIYSETRCMNINTVIDYINKTTNYYENLRTSLQKKYSKDNLDNLSLNELGEFTQMKPELYKYKDDKPYIFQCFNLASHLKQKQNGNKYQAFSQREQMLLGGRVPSDLIDYYKTLISQKQDLKEILRIMVLESVIQEGISGYSKIKREILDVYGFEKIFLFKELERVGFLREKKIIHSNKGAFELNFNFILKKFNLINENFDFRNVKDCSFVCGGFCPLTLRLIEKLLDGGWGNIADHLKKIPGKLVYPMNEKELLKYDGEINIIYVIFLGGVTYAEIEGIRYLNRREKELFESGKALKRKRIQFIIITTNVLNHKRLFQQFDKHVELKLTYKKYYDTVMSKKK